MRLRDLFKLLPETIRHRIIRSRLRLNPEASSDFIFKPAETKEELEEAFAVLHDAYVGQGYMDPHASGLRVTKYHALPTTTVLVAKDRNSNRVVGTISIVRNTALGIPLDSAFSIKHIKSQYAHFAEVSSLAIRKEYRNKPTDLLWPFLRYFYRYCRDVMKLDAYIIGVNPSWHDLYSGILGFKRLSGLSLKEYSFVKNAPVVAYIADLAEQELIFYKEYSHLDRVSNWYQYCIKDKLEPERHLFPNHRYHAIQHPVMTRELLNHFFVERTDALNLMTQEERAMIQNYYPRKDFSEIFMGPNVFALETPRSSDRFLTRIRALLGTEKGIERLIALEVLDCSKGGMKVRSEVELPQEFGLWLDLGPRDTSFVRVRQQRKVENEYGLKLISSDSSWSEFVVEMQNSMRVEPARAGSFLQTTNKSSKSG